ncbi:MAG: hypothetical protein JNK38_23835 [Acidobacteria bacterium]|nr:hypothetical protein [Acidobacteriota bacterium]
MFIAISSFAQDIKQESSAISTVSTNLPIEAKNASQSDPWVIFLFYEHPNLKGRRFFSSAKLPANTTSIKYDLYDFEPSVGDNTISSFVALASHPMQITLFEHPHFHGRFTTFDLSATGEYVVNNLSDSRFNFNDITSSIAIALGGRTTNPRIPFRYTVEPFRMRVKETLESATDSQYKISLHDTEVNWVNALEMLQRRRMLCVCPGDFDERRIFDDAVDTFNPLYTAEYGFLKDVDLIQFFQHLTIEVPFGNEVKLRFWVKPVVSDGRIKFLPWGWEYWVERGPLNGFPFFYNVKEQLERAIRPRMTAALRELASTIDQRVSDALGTFATNVERVSFNLDEYDKNQFTQAGDGTAQATPPTIVLRHKQ